MIKLASVKQMDRLEDKQRKELEAHIAGSRVALEFLKDVLKERADQIEAKKLSKLNYDSPNYPCLIADLHGTKRTINEVIELLTEVDQTNV